MRVNLLPVHEVNGVVLQINEVNAFSLHLPELKHGSQVLHTTPLELPNVSSLKSINDGPRHAVPQGINISSEQY